MSATRTGVPQGDTTDCQQLASVHSNEQTVHHIHDTNATNQVLALHTKQEY